MQKGAETYLREEFKADLNIDGPTLIGMSPSQFSSMSNSKENYGLLDLLCRWIKYQNFNISQTKNNMILTSDINQIEKVKIESPHAPEFIQIKQEDTSQIMLPASVVNHNMCQEASNILLPPYKHAIQMQPSTNTSASEETNFKNYHQQGNEICSTFQNYAMDHDIQSFTQLFNQQSSMTNQPISPRNVSDQGSNSARQMSQVSHQLASVAPLPQSSSAMESQNSPDQHDTQSTNNLPVPLRDGLKCYSDVDLSTLVQHPITLNQEESKDTDGKYKY